MNKKEFYIKFINFLVDKGYSEAEIAKASGISPPTINRSRSGQTKLGAANQKLLDTAFEKEKIAFEGSQGIETTPDAKDKIISELQEKEALRQKLVGMLEERVYEMKDHQDILRGMVKQLKEENEQLKEEIKRLKGG